MNNAELLMGLIENSNKTMPLQVDENGYLLIDDSQLTPSVNFASGTYTGNGGSSKSITLSFTPKFVAVCRSAIVTTWLFLLSTTGARNIYIVTSGAAPANGGSDDQIITNGFKVDNHMNTNGAGYLYIAIG